MKKIILLLSTVILVFLVACGPVKEVEEESNGVPVIEPKEPSERPSGSLDDTVVNQRNDQKNDEVDEEAGFAGITKQQCVEANGHWNECGSPCAGTGADFCIELCQVQCECGGIAGFACPDGFKCRLSGKIADEMGVCVKE